jgi:hypothetical protein
METGVTCTDLSIVSMPAPAAESSAIVAPSSIRIVEVLNPFQPSQRRVELIKALDNESLGALITRAGLEPEKFNASICGERIEDAEIWRTVPVAGQEVVLFPHTGGRAAGMIAMIGLSAIMTFLTAGGYLAAAAGLIDVMLTGGVGAFAVTTGAALLGMALSIGGALLISWALSPGQPSQPAFSTTYDPTGPKGLAQPGVPVPKGYGVMGWCGNVVSSYVSFDGQDAYIYALVCYGFGHALQISNVLINGKPISEYANCSYQVRLGTNNQTPIAGFDQSVNGYAQETQLKVSNGPVTVPGTGTDIQALQITCKFPSGLYRTTNDGNYVPLKLIYLIQVAPHGTDTWQAPFFPNTTQEIFTTDPNGNAVYPAWVVVPTDRFAGSGIVYAWDNGSHTPGDVWSGTQTVSTIDMNGDSSDASTTFQGVWQPCDPTLGPVGVTSWTQGYRMVETCNMSPFFDTVSIYGLAPGQWDVQVTKIGYEQDNQNWQIVFADSTDAQHICDIWLWNVNEITLSNLAYPNMILVGVQALATAQMSGADLQVMCDIVHGLGEDTVLPSALASFETDNPAVVAYDVLTNPLYGMGVMPANIDVPAFVAWAEFNDEIVTNQDGSEARRQVFAGVFDQKSDAWKTLQTIGNMSRAAVVQMGMNYSVVIDAPAEPVQLFTVGNTKKDSFKESWLSLDDRCVLIECDFADAARSYRTDLPVSVMTEADINSGISPKPARMQLIGCTSRDQAWRWAYFQLMSTKLTLRTMELTAPIEACCCTPGSVIGVQTDVTQWGVGGRVQPGSTLETVNVERTDLAFGTPGGWTVSVQHPVVLRGTATILTIAGTAITMTAALPTGRILKAVGPDGTEYIVNGYNTTQISVDTLTPQAATVALAAGQVVKLYDVNVIDVLPVSNVVVTPASSNGPGGSVVTVAGSFSIAPIPGCAWAYGQSAGSQPAKLFRVTRIDRSGDFNFKISGAEYNAEMYEDVTPNYGQIVGVPNTTPAIKNLTLSEIFQNGLAASSIGASVVAVGWQNGNTAVGGQVMIKAGSGAYQLLGNIQGQGCTFVGTQGVTYTVQVTGMDWAGNLLGTPVTATITVVAAANAPANVTGFTGTSGSTSTILSWNAVTGADHYEIRYTTPGAPDWLTAAVLWDGTATTWTDTTLRTGVYMIVAVSSLATGSVESILPATWQSASALSLPLSNINPSSLVWVYGGGGFVSYGSTGGQVWMYSPYGSAVNRSGVQVQIPKVIFELIFSGPLTPNTTYYFYLYLDANFTMQSPNINPTAGAAGSAEAGTSDPVLFVATSGGNGNALMLDAGYNDAHAAQAISSGCLAWACSFLTDANGYSGWMSNGPLTQTILTL